MDRIRRRNSAWQVGQRRRELNFGDRRLPTFQLPLAQLLFLALLINGGIAVAAWLYPSKLYSANLPNVARYYLDLEHEMGWVRFSKLGYEVTLVELGKTGRFISITRDGIVLDYPTLEISRDDDFKEQAVEQTIYRALVRATGGSLHPKDDFGFMKVWEDNGTPLTDEEISSLTPEPSPSARDSAMFDRSADGGLQIFGEKWDKLWEEYFRAASQDRPWRLRVANYQQYRGGVLQVYGCGWPLPSIYSVYHHDAMVGAGRNIQHLGNTISLPHLLFSTVFWFLALAFVAISQRNARGYYRLKRGYCMTCGYDLRANREPPGCPECGWNLD